MNHLQAPSYKLPDIDQLPDSVRVGITNEAIKGVYIDGVKERLKAHQVNVSLSVSQWLNNQKSAKTKTTYKKALDDFFAFLKRLDVHPLLATAQDVDLYGSQLNRDLKNNSVRLKMMACSSFYATLKRYQHISYNPFLGSALPVKEYKKSNLDSPVMCEDDFNRIIKAIINHSFPDQNAHISLKRKATGYNRLLVPVHIMGAYGLRVGALPTITVKRGVAHYIGKGNKQGSIILSDETKKLLQDRPIEFSKLKVNSLQVAFKKLTTRMHRNNEIKLAYTCHDLRHFFAKVHYTTNKDLIRLKSLLGHSSVNVTEIYLQSIISK